MGIGLSLMLNKEIPDAELHDTDGKTLFDCAPTLDKIGKSKGIKPSFSSFIFDPESMDEPPEGELLEETYYDPKDGLRVVTGLITALEAPDGKARKQIEGGGGILYPLSKVLGVKSGMEGKWFEYCLADLKELERCLKLAAKAKAGFCLLTC
ncbi:MAG TPA: hypothetical protein VFE62_16735 [Gemmataceae bacterium]|nr:hypothetical protein [Gemmataceae bacterium]